MAKPKNNIGPMEPTPNLLSPETWAEVAKGEKALQEAAMLMDKGEQCGIDCSQMREYARDMESRLANVRKHFGYPDAG